MHTKGTVVHLRRGGREHGASAVEFALVLPILVILVVGIVEMGLAFNRQQSFHAASREAARLVSVGYDLSGDGLISTVLSQTRSVDESDISVVVSPEGGCAGTGEPEDLVTVAVFLSGNLDRYAIRIPFIPTASPDFRSEATFRCEVQP